MSIREPERFLEREAVFRNWERTHMQMLATSRDDAPPHKVDGRNLRAETTRRKIVAGARALIEEDARVPRMADVAGRAGVSIRSVFQHYLDVDTLFVAVVDDVLAEIERTVPLSPHAGPLATRVAQLIDRRIDIYERTASLLRAAQQLNPTPAALQTRLADQRAFARNRIERVFGTELAALPATERQEVALALQAVTDWSLWLTLRAQHDATREAAAAIVRRLLMSLLGTTAK